MKTVTVIIPSLHRPDLTTRCIAFLQKQTLPASEWEILVMENDAQAGSVLPAPLPPNTQRIDLPSNEGTTGSINRGVAASSSKYLLLLNNDVELDPDYIEKLMRAMEQDPKLGFATGKLLRATQRTHFDGAGDAMLIGGGAYRLGHRDADTGQFDERKKVLSGCGAAVLYRRDTFQDCGWLDEEFFAYSDDLDLALRAQLLGTGGSYVPDAVAYHIGSATLGATLHPRIVELLTRNQLFILMKDYPRAVWLRALPRIIVYQLLWLLYATKSGNFSAYVRGVGGAVRGRGAMRRKHSELSAKRGISDEQFFELLRESERQVFDWQQSRPESERSGLLKLYFSCFGKP